MQAYQEEDDRSSNDGPECVSYELHIEQAIDVSSSEGVNFELWIFVFLQLHQLGVECDFPVSDEILLCFLPVSHVTIADAFELDRTSNLETHSCHLGFSVGYIEIF